MHREDAVLQAQQAIADLFVVLDVGSFDTEQQESETTIKLVGEAGSVRDRPDAPIIPQPADEEADVFYVTLGFNSVEGDGTFRATARVTKDGAKVVDFEALP